MNKKDNNDKRVVTKKKNIFIVSPALSEPPVPLCCPICEYLMRDQGDIIKFREFGCCSICSSYFAEPNREKWKEGWRPAQERIDTLVKKRKEQYSYIADI